MASVGYNKINVSAVFIRHLQLKALLKPWVGKKLIMHIPVGVGYLCYILTLVLGLVEY